MVFPMEQAHPGLYAKVFQGREHLEGIAHIAAVVFVRLDEQGGRLGLMGIF